MIAYGFIMKIQLNKPGITFPHLIGKRIAAWTALVEVHIDEPILIFRLLSFLLQVVKCPKTSADMVEYTVEHDPDTVFVKCLEYLLKVIFTA